MGGTQGIHSGLIIIYRGWVTHAQTVGGTHGTHSVLILICLGWVTYTRSSLWAIHRILGGAYGVHYGQIVTVPTEEPGKGVQDLDDHVHDFDGNLDEVGLLGLRFKFQGWGGARVGSVGCRVQDLGLRAESPGLGIKGLGFRI